MNVMLKSPSLCDADGQGGRPNGWLWSFAAPRFILGGATRDMVGSTNALTWMPH